MRVSLYDSPKDDDHKLYFICFFPKSFLFQFFFLFILLALTDSMIVQQTFLITGMKSIMKEKEKIHLVLGQVQQLLTILQCNNNYVLPLINLQLL